MYEIVINDPKAYQAGKIFAQENHSTLDELVNRYVASLAAKVLSRPQQTTAFTQTEEFRKAMQLMDSFVVNDLSKPVSVEENGAEAMSRLKYGL